MTTIEDQSRAMGQGIGSDLTAGEVKAKSWLSRNRPWLIACIASLVVGFGAGIWAGST